MRLSNTYTDRNEGSINKYLQEIAPEEVLSPEAEKDLVRKIKEGGPEAEKAREELIRKNLKFVVTVAKQYKDVNSKLTLNDLINEGNIGLMNAIERFDEEKGAKLISFAVWYIREAVLQAINKGYTIHLPLNKVGLLSKIRKAEEKFIY